MGPDKNEPRRRTVEEQDEPARRADAEPARVPTPGTAEGGESPARPNSMPPLPGKTPGSAEGPDYDI